MPRDRLRRPLGCLMIWPDAGAQEGIGYEIRGLLNAAFEMLVPIPRLFLCMAASHS